MNTLMAITFVGGVILGIANVVLWIAHVKKAPKHLIESTNIVKRLFVTLAFLTTFATIGRTDGDSGEQMGTFYVPPVKRKMTKSKVS